MLNKHLESVSLVSFPKGFLVQDFVTWFIKWSASSRWSIDPNSGCGSIETMTSGKTHPTSLHAIAQNRRVSANMICFVMNFGGRI